MMTTRSKVVTFFITGIIIPFLIVLIEFNTETYRIIIAGCFVLIIINSILNSAFTVSYNFVLSYVLLRYIYSISLILSSLILSHWFMSLFELWFYIVSLVIFGFCFRHGSSCLFWIYHKYVSGYYRCSLL